MDIKNIAHTSIPLDENKNISKPYWVKLSNKTGTIEGKIYFPQKGTNKIIIFEPGFPGGGSTQFEKLWLKKILQNGYAVFLIRHGGTLINGKYSFDYLNCKERIRLGNKQKGGTIGNKSLHSISDWLNEPLIALEVLTPHFSKITLCGHSFGPLALIHSLIRYTKKEPKQCKKINRVVSLSGSLGMFRNKKHPFLKVWYDHLNTKWAQERVKIGDPKSNTNIFYDAHIEINKKANLIPKHIEFIAVVPWGKTQRSTDEIVHPIESLEFITSLGRGCLVIDEKEWGDKKTGRMVHDMEALTENDLLDFISEDWLPKTQISTLK